MMSAPMLDINAYDGEVEGPHHSQFGQDFTEFSKHPLKDACVSSNVAHPEAEDDAPHYSDSGLSDLEPSEPKNTTQIQLPTPSRSLETFIRFVLPEEVRVMVLKELLKHWATNIPLRSLTCNRSYIWEPRPSGSYQATNRAVLVYISSPGEEQNCNYPDIELGWCAIPMTAGMNWPFRYIDTVSGTPHEWLDLGYLLSAQSSSEHPIRISNILLTSRSKRLKVTIEGFFYHHMIWEFQNKRHLFAAMKGNTVHSTDVLGKLRNLSLELSEWDTFVDLVEELEECLRSRENPFTNLLTLEIYGKKFSIKRFFVGGRAVEDTIRIRYLVTRCYGLVQLFPDLTICLAGTSKVTSDAPRPTVERSTEETEGTENSKYWEVGLGFTAEEVAQYKNGTFSGNLRSIEFDDMPRKAGMSDAEFHQHELSDTHWKMKFSQEWAKIWAQGTKLPVESGGYDKVSDHKLTLSGLPWL